MAYVPCTTECTGLQLRDMILHGMKVTEDEGKQSVLLTSLGNIKHIDDVPILTSALISDRPIPVRLAATKALRRMPLHNGQGSFKMLYDIAVNDENRDIRVSAVESLAYPTQLQHLCHHQDFQLVVANLANHLAITNTTEIDFVSWQVFLAKRAECASADQASALTIAIRLVQLSAKLSSTNVLLNKTYTWESENASINLHVEALYHIDQFGFTSKSDSWLSASLFGRSFTLADAGAYARWQANGYATLMVWFSVHLIDVLTDEIETYDVVMYQYSVDLVIGISSGDICSMDPPPSNRVAYRASRAFARFSYYYAIPALADIDLTVLVVRWFEIRYGIAFVLAENTTVSLSKMAIKAFVTPALGVDAQASANAQLLILTGCVRGTLTLANAELPVLASANTNTTTLGSDISLQATFLKGQLNFYYDIYWCCCFSCWWSCCFDCGGSCNKNDNILLFKWDGLELSYNILSHPVCTQSEKHHAISLAHVLQTDDLTYIIQTSLRAPYEFEYDCQQEVVLNRRTNERSNYLDVCRNTYCFLEYMWTEGGKWGPRFDANTRIWSTQLRGDESNTRGIMQSDIEITSAERATLSLDEFPLNSLLSSGCFARVQKMNKQHNSAHGLAWRAFTTYVWELTDRFQDPFPEIDINLSRLYDPDNNPEPAEGWDTYCCQNDPRRNSRTQLMRTNLESYKNIPNTVLTDIYFNQLCKNPLSTTSKFDNPQYPNNQINDIYPVSLEVCPFIYSWT